MKIFLENFNFYYDCLSIQEINETSITFLLHNDWESYGLKYYDNYSDLIKNFDGNKYNLFNLIQNNDTLYIDFSNLLTPNNKKEKLNVVENIKHFIETYGYIFNFTLEEKSSSTITRPFDEIIYEIQKFNALLGIQDTLYELTKKNNEETFSPFKLNPIKFVSELMNSDKFLRIYKVLYNFNEEIKIENPIKLEGIIDCLKNISTFFMNSIISNCKFNFDYSENNTSTYQIVCSSLLEVMYLQFISNTSDCNKTVRRCSHCGKYVEIDNHNKDKENVFCKMTKEDKEMGRTKSKCASNFNVAKYREKQKGCN